MSERTVRSVYRTRAALLRDNFEFGSVQELQVNLEMIYELRRLNVNYIWSQQEVIRL